MIFRRLSIASFRNFSSGPLRLPAVLSLNIDFTEMDHALGSKQGYDRPDIGCHRFFLTLHHQRKYNTKKKDIQTASVFHRGLPP
jgi:hypothetical protein